MTISLNLARQVMQGIIASVNPQSLNYTTYCAMVVKLSDNRVVVVAQAGGTVTGFGGGDTTQLAMTLMNLENQLNVPIIGCTDQVQLPTPHENDAERHALRTVLGQPTFNNAVIKAIVASRPICQYCMQELQQHGLRVLANRNEADL